MSDHDRTNQPPLAQNTAKDLARVGQGEDLLSAEATGEQPELGELGAEDIISDADDGATQIMTREQAPPSAKKPALSSLDALAATIPAKGRTMPPSHVPGKKVPPLPPMKAVAPPPVATPVVVAAAAPPIPATLLSAQTPVPEMREVSKFDTQPTHTPRVGSVQIPRAPTTAPIVDLDDEDLVTRIDRTQPFDRNKIFGAPSRPNEGRPASSPPPAVANPAANPSAMTQPSAAWRPTPLPPDLAASIAPAAPTTAPTSLSQTLSQPHRPSQSLPSVMVAEPLPPPPHHRPASIAPLAIDITTPASHWAPEQPAMSLSHPAYKPPMNQTHLLTAAIAGGVALCAAAIIAIVAVSSTSSDEPTATAQSTKNTPTITVAPPKPREAQKGTARSAVIETPETTPSRAAAPLAARDEDGTPLSSPGALPSAPGSHAKSSEGSGVSTGGSQPSEKPEKPTRASRAAAKAAAAAAAAQPASTPEPAAAPPPPVAAAPAAPPPPARPAGPAPTTGVIEVPATLMTVMVDGDYKRVNGGRIVVTCGRHRVNAGRGTQSVDVPCGGVASVM